MQTASADPKVRELGYEEYQSRQLEEIELGQLNKRADALKVGNRAKWVNEQWQSAPYPGYAMQAMLQESIDHAAVSLEMRHMQQELLDSLGQSGLLYPLPAASFHQTVANTFSADRLELHLKSKGIEEQFPEMLRQSLTNWETTGFDAPPRMRMIGISIFRTAIGLLGTFDQQEDFQRIIEFRDYFYSQPELAQIGLKRTRPFIGHLTLAYVESDLSDDQKKQLVECISVINKRIQAQDLTVELPNARLHEYADLSAFRTYPNYPVAKL